MASVRVAAIVPPPVKPSPAVIVTPLCAMCSSATKPDRSSCTISAPTVVTVISFPLADVAIPVPPTILKLESIRLTVPVPVSPARARLVETVAVDAAVKRPC